MNTKKIKHCGKLHEVSKEVHRGYETATRRIIRKNKDFYDNETPFEKVYKVDLVSFEEKIEDSLIVTQAMKIANEHLTENEYEIFQKIILDGLSLRETAEIVGVSYVAVYKRKQKIFEKIRNLLN